MADSGPFKIVGWMSDDFSSWLQTEVPAMPKKRLLTPQHQTLKIAMSVLSWISSSLHPGTDLI